MTALIKTLPLSVCLLAVTSGCELLNYDEGIAPPLDDGIYGEGGPPAAAPLFPFKPGNAWQYSVTGLDGSKSTKTVRIDPKKVMVGGNGYHQLDMAYPVRISDALGPDHIVTLQDMVGDRVLSYREQVFDQQRQMVLDVDWEPHQLEVDQSVERTRPGTSWMEHYIEVARPSGGIPTTVRQAEGWTVVGREPLTLPGIAITFDTVVYQKGAVPNPPPDGGGSGPADAGKSGDGGVLRPMLTQGQTWSEAADSGVPLPKTLWFARGYGKVKEAGGGQPTEELTGLELK